MKSILLISISTIGFFTCSNQYINNLNTESRNMVEAIILKHIGISDKLISPVLLAPMEFDTIAIEKEIMINDKYLPMYYHVKYPEDLITNLFYSKRSEIISVSNEKQSINFGSIEIIVILNNHSEIFYLGNKSDSKDVIFSLFKALNKSSITESNLDGLEIFFCNLITKSFPCIKED